MQTDLKIPAFSQDVARAPAPIVAGTKLEGGRSPAPPATDPAVPARDVQRPEDSPSRADVDRATRRMNDYVQTVNRNLQFSVDDDSGQTVIKVVDSETHELIRQIPPDEMLALARHLVDDGGGQPILLETRT